jgi:hypothetical protein
MSDMTTIWTLFECFRFLTPGWEVANQCKPWDVVFYSAEACEQYKQKFPDFRREDTIVTYRCMHKSVSTWQE